jgi:hypothetical protein
MIDRFFDFVSFKTEEGWKFPMSSLKIWRDEKWGEKIF